MLQIVFGDLDDIFVWFKLVISDLSLLHLKLSFCVIKIALLSF